MKGTGPIPSGRPAQRGFGVIAAMVVLVGLAALAGAVLRLGVGTQMASAQDLQAAYATQTARAGVEWGLYQALKGIWTSCTAASSTLDLGASTGMLVTVSCSDRTFNDGETAPGAPRVLRTVTIDAVACNGSGACPDVSASARPGYVERRVQVVAVGP